jgi:hypothetical protein
MTRICRGHALPEVPPPHAEPDAGKPTVDRARRPWRIADAARSSIAPAAGRHAPARGLQNARVREPNAAIRASDSRCRERKFSCLQTVENKRNRIGISQNPPRREGAGATARPPRRTETSSKAAPVLGAVRRKSAPRRRRGAKFSYPQPLEKARNGEGISRAIAPRGGPSRRSRQHRLRPSSRGRPSNPTSSVAQG